MCLWFGVPGLPYSISMADLLCWNAHCVRSGIRLNRQLDKVSLTSFCFVGNVPGHRIVFVRGAEVAMKLINGFNRRKAFKGGEGPGLGAFPRTAVDHCDSRIQR